MKLHKILFLLAILAGVGMYAKIIPKPSFIKSLPFQGEATSSSQNSGGVIGTGMVTGTVIGSGGVMGSGVATIGASTEIANNGWGCGCGEGKCHTGFQYASMPKAIEAMRRKCGGKCSPNCQAKYDRAPSGGEGTATANGPAATPPPPATGSM